MLMRIKEHRENSNMSQKEVAESMGVLQTSVCNWETELALPRTRQLPQLAAVLGCTIEDLFTDEAKGACHYAAHEA